MKSQTKKAFIFSFFIVLVIFLVVPRYNQAFNFENFSKEEIGKYLEFPEKDTRHLLNRLIGPSSDEWAFLKGSGYSTPEEEVVPLILRKAIRTDTLKYLMIDAPVGMMVKIIKNTVEIARLFYGLDASTILEKIEQETVKRAVEYGMNFLLQNEIRITPGAINVRYETKKGNTQEAILQYILVFSPLNNKQGEVGIKVYSPEALAPPASRGSIGVFWGMPNTLEKDLPPFIVTIQGKVKKAESDYYDWTGNPEIVISFPENVPDLGFKPLSFWQRHLWKPLKNEVKETGLVLGKIFGGFKSFVLGTKPKAQLVSETAQSSSLPGQGFEDANIPLPPAPLDPSLKFGEGLTGQEKLTEKALFFEKSKEAPEEKIALKEKEVPKKAGVSLDELVEQFDEISERVEIILAQTQKFIAEKSTEQKDYRIRRSSDSVIEKVQELEGVSKETEEVEETKEESEKTEKLKEEIEEKIKEEELPKEEIGLCSVSGGQSPARNKVIFNEIAWMGSINSSNDEWIELKNNSGTTVDLTGWQILDKDVQLKVFLENVALNPGGFFLLERTDDNSVPNVSADSLYAGALGNTEETLYLFDKNCELQDKVEANPYWAAGSNASKKTMERDSSASPQNDRWQTSSNVGGTPKAQNSSGEIYYVGAGGGDTISLAVQEPPAASPPLKSPPLPKILITEIQLDSPEGASDEFIELYNPNEENISLEKWSIQRASAGGVIYKKNFEAGDVILSKGYFLIVNKYASQDLLNLATLTHNSFSITSNNSIFLVKNQEEIVSGAEERISDKLGYGTAFSPEGTSASEPSTGQSLGRKWIEEIEEYQDRDNNQEDFELQIPTPGAKNERDLIPPETKITSSPPFLTNQNQISFSFSANEQNCVFQCQLDTEGWKKCSSPISYSELSDGSHLFQVKAIDAGGNPDNTPAQHTWVVDTIPPSSHVEKLASSLTSTSITIKWSGADKGSGIASYEVQYKDELDGEWQNLAAATTSLQVEFTGQDKHTYYFQIKAKDAAGNEESWPQEADAFTEIETPKDDTDTEIEKMTTTTEDNVAPIAEAGPDQTVEIGEPITFDGSGSSDNIGIVSFKWDTDNSNGLNWETPDLTGKITTLQSGYSTSGISVVTLRVIDAAGNTATDTLIVFVSPPPEILITEIQIETDDSVDYDFIELFNPTTTTLNISGFQLKKKSSIGTEYSIRVFPENSLIPPRDYFLWANSKYASSGKISADVTSTQTLAKNNSLAFLSKKGNVVDAVAWGSSTNPFVETAPFPKNPNKSYTLGRKIDSESNYVETNNNSQDFELQVPTPKTKNEKDITLPKTEILSKPPLLTNQKKATFLFTVNKENPSFRCRLDNQDWRDCSSPITYANLSDGSHFFQVKATDFVGNEEIKPVQYSWIVDTAIENPILSLADIDSDSPFYTNERTVKVIISQDGEVVGWFLAENSEKPTADDTNWLSVKPVTFVLSESDYSPLSGQVKTLYLWTKDSAGNISQFGNSASIVLDTVPPLISIENEPDNPTNQTQAFFSFSSNEEGPTFQCKLDSQDDWENCSSSITYTELAEGSHLFYVKAIDRAGNYTSTSPDYSWLIDITPPSSQVTVLATSSTSTILTIRWIGSDGNGSGILDYDVQYRNALEEEWSYLAQGTSTQQAEFTGQDEKNYYFRSQARDMAGNEEDWPNLPDAVVKIEVPKDTIPPETKITSSPPFLTNQNQISFSFSANEQGCTFQCQLDAQNWKECSSPISHSNLSDNSHLFQVKAIDAGGNPDNTPAQHTWVVDTIPPSSWIEERATSSTSTTLIIKWSGADKGSGIVSYEVQYKDGSDGGWQNLAVATTSLEVEFTGEDKHTYYFQSKAKDAAANEESWPQEADAFTEIEVPKDKTPPSRISDLIAETGNNQGEIILTWTAPADDWEPIKASQYIIKYYSEEITEENWDSAMKAKEPPEPQEASSTESFIVSGLVDNTPYYFAIRAKDKAGNTSRVSNSPSAETLASILEVSTTILNFSAVQGGSNPQSQFLTVKNKGKVKMSWNISTNLDWVSAVRGSGSLTAATATTTASTNVEIAVDISGLEIGSYQATATITAINAKQSPKNIQIQLNVEESPNQAPVSAFSYSPENPTVEQEITFNGSSSTDPDGEIIAFLWDFGDDWTTTTQSPIITHSFTFSSQFQIWLWVQDDKGATSSPTTVTIEVFEKPKPKILISEVQTGTIDSSDHDFIELFNPATSSLDISGFQLKKKSSPGKEDSVRVFPENSIIPAQSYFLWANSKYDNIVQLLADATSTQTLAKNNSVALLDKDKNIIDAVAWGTSTNPFVETTSFPQNPEKNQSLGRKWATTTQSYEDTNNNQEDFELQIPTPKTKNKTFVPIIEPPQITQPQQNQIFNAAADIVPENPKIQIEVQGTSTAQFLILAFGAQEQLQATTTVVSTGEWSLKLTLTEGENLFGFRAQNSQLHQSSTTTLTLFLDTMPPAKIENLSAATTSPTSTDIKLNWIAPGDDGMQGTSTAYIIKYSTSSPTTSPEAWWQGASLVQSPPTPSPASTTETFVVSNLTSGNTYYFAILAKDEAENSSEISNIAEIQIPFPDAIYTVTTGLSRYLDWASGYLESNNARRITRASDGTLYVVYAKEIEGILNTFLAQLTDPSKGWQEQTITESRYEQEKPSVAIDSKDNVHIVWQGKIEGNNSWQIRYRKYDSAKGIWQDIENLTSEEFDQQNPSIAIDSQNNIHIVWSGKIPGYDYFQIRYRKYTDSWQTTEDLISQDYCSKVYSHSCNQDYPVLAIDSNDNLHLVWRGQNYWSGVGAGGTSYGIYYRKYDGSWQNIEQLKRASFDKGKFLSIAVDDNDNIHIVWERTRYNGIEYCGWCGPYQIWYQKYAGTWESPINLYEGPIASNEYQEQPSVSLDSEGNIYVVWYGRKKEGSIINYKIYFKKYTDSWQEPEILVADGLNQYPNLLFGFWPKISGQHTNIPKTGYAFLYQEGGTLKFYPSPNLIWP